MKENLLEAGKGYTDKKHPSVFTDESIHTIKEYTVYYNKTTNKLAIDLIGSKDFFARKHQTQGDYLTKIESLQKEGYLNLDDKYKVKRLLEKLERKIKNKSDGPQM